jgi:hypothetical protein
MSQSTKIVRTLPWGEEIYLEIPLHKKSANKFYARHGKTGDGREYIEFSKFGPKPNTDGENYMQKLRLYAPLQWAQIKHFVDGELAESIGWDVATAQKDFEQSLKEDAKPKDKEKVAT